jgi:hypothetical protein
MKLVLWHTDDGVRHVLVVQEGPKWLTILAMGDSSFTKVPAIEGRHMKDMPDYPLERAKKHFRTNLRRNNNSTLRGLSTKVRNAIRKE